MRYAGSCHAGMADQMNRGALLFMKTIGPMRLLGRKLLELREEDPLKRQREFMTRMVSLITGALTMALFLLTLAMSAYGMIPAGTSAILGMMCVLYIFCWLFMAHGRWRLSGLITPSIIFLSAVYGNFTGGIDSPASLLYCLVMLLVGMMYRRRFQWLTVGVILATYLSLGLAHYSGTLVRSRSSETAFLNSILINTVLIIGFFLLLRLLLMRYVGALNKSVLQAGENSELAERNRELYIQALGEIRERYAAEERAGKKNEELAAANEELAATLENLEETNEELTIANERFAVAKDEIEASEQRFRILSDQSLMAILVIRDNKMVYFNSAFCEISGFSADELSALGLMKFLERVHHDDRPLMIENMRKKISNEIESSRYVYRAIKKDGIMGWYEIFSKRIVFDGRPSIYAVIVDRSAEKENELKLNDLLQRYSAIMENAHEVILVIRDMRIMYANPRFNEIMGYTTEEALGMEFSKFISPDDRDAVIANYRSRLRGELIDPIYTFRVIDKTGSEKWAETHTTSITWEGKPAMLNMLTDITDRKLAEESLRESEERYRGLVEASPDPIIMHGPEGDIIAANRRAVWFFGFDTEESFRSRIRSIVSLVAQGDRPRLEADLARAVESGPALGNEYLTVSATDGPRSVEISMSAVRDSRGDIFAFISLLHDVTERKNTENLLKSSLREKDVLLKEIHHRVKNNFQIIVSLLSLQMDKEMNEDAVRNLENAQNRIRAMALIHEKLYQSNNLAMIDFSEYLRSMSEEVYKSHCNEPMKVALEIAIEPLFLSLDKAIPLGLAVSELLTNAMKYAFPKGRSGKVTVRLIPMGKEDVEISVMDDGVGLPVGFNPEKARTLGMNLVHILVRDQLKGRVSFSREGGTAVTLRFRSV